MAAAGALGALERLPELGDGQRRHLLRREAIGLQAVYMLAQVRWPMRAGAKRVGERRRAEERAVLLQVGPPCTIVPRAAGAAVARGRGRRDCNHRRTGS